MELLDKPILYHLELPEHSPESKDPEVWLLMGWVDCLLWMKVITVFLHTMMLPQDQTGQTQIMFWDKLISYRHLLRTPQRRAVLIIWNLLPLIMQRTIFGQPMNLITAYCDMMFWLFLLNLFHLQQL